METVTRIATLRERVALWRRNGERVGFVPTMGNLHAGHFSLIDLARSKADRVVASVFVNPTQFGPREDFASYPRTLDQDRAGLDSRGCDLLFAPEIVEMYPFGPAASVRVEVPVISETLEGAVRPGHFAGVATVVTKLFNQVQPDVAVFGQKDYQQLKLIERLVRDLCLPIEIVAGPTLREANGLAMSSRNQYLSDEERARAGIIYRTLRRMRDAVREGRSFVDVEAMAQQALVREGLVPDYAVLKNASDLTDPDSANRSNLIALIAARMGRTRLIDNFLTDL